MGRLFKYLRKHKEDIFRSLLFVITVAILVILLPTERKFGFEFRKGAPWMHEDLIAPFDFAIQKDKDVIEKQQDSILKLAKIFYRFKPQTFIDYDSVFNEETEKGIEAYAADKSLSGEQLRDINFYLDIIRLMYSNIMHQGIADTLFTEEDQREIALIR
ncbi:MAG: hypothetical protein C0599_16795, partial [Salinivirgaceae bacterium]